MNLTDNFFVSAYESGSRQSNLPLWGNRSKDPFHIATAHSADVIRKDMDKVTGAFQLLNVINAEACQQLINVTEELGYTEDAAVSLGRNVRHNMNLNWIVDEESEKAIWNKASGKFSANNQHFMKRKPLGLNQRFRFYKYEQGDFFNFHHDGAWPGSKIINDSPIADAYGDRQSLFTFLLFLNDDYQGGETLFVVNDTNTASPKASSSGEVVSVRTPKCAALCFPHGSHPEHCLHGSQVISQGVKYIIRTDVLFTL